MKRLLLVFLGFMGFVTIAHVQSDPAEMIRARVVQIDKSATGIPSSDTEADAVIWTGAYARPVVGATKPDPKDFVAAPNRRNIQSKTTIERIVVSQDRTMAYEYRYIHADVRRRWRASDAERSRLASVAQHGHGLESQREFPTPVRTRSDDVVI